MLNVHMDPPSSFFFFILHVDMDPPNLSLLLEKARNHVHHPRVGWKKQGVWVFFFNYIFSSQFIQNVIIHLQFIWKRTHEHKSGLQISVLDTAQSSLPVINISLTQWTLTIGANSSSITLVHWPDWKTTLRSPTRTSGHLESGIETDCW